MGNKQTEHAAFAGGCFWCVQHAFDDIDGVLSTQVGYTGGTVKSPTYEQVCSGTTGHFEAIQITFDPSKISYKKLLDIYWHNIDPTKTDGQFCDIGSQYRPAIFYHDESQKKIAEESKKELLKTKNIVVEILPAQPFYPAEDYHQKYYQKSPFRYELYDLGSGRKNRLKELWGNQK